MFNITFVSPQIFLYREKQSPSGTQIYMRYVPLKLKTGTSPSLYYPAVYTTRVPPLGIGTYGSYHPLFLAPSPGPAENVVYKISAPLDIPPFTLCLVHTLKFILLLIINVFIR